MFSIFIVDMELLKLNRLLCRNFKLVVKKCIMINILILEQNLNSLYFVYALICYICKFTYQRSVTVLFAILVN